MRAAVLLLAVGAFAAPQLNLSAKVVETQQEVIDYVNSVGTVRLPRSLSSSLFTLECVVSALSSFADVDRWRKSPMVRPEFRIPYIVNISIRVAPAGPQRLPS